MVHNAQWSGSAAKWSRSQDKAFEQCLVMVPEAAPDRWERIAIQIPGKSATEVEDHYNDLVHDVMEIESGRVELPIYENESPSSAKAERRKGVPWTDQEHLLFLEGLNKYGRGDWRSISRNSVVTRTPTQVASHAQKYYLRLNSDGSSSGKKEKKRSSIHDMTFTAAGVGSVAAQGQAHYHKWFGPEHIGPSRAFRDQASYFG